MNTLPVIFVDTRATDPEWFKLARAQAHLFNKNVFWIGERPHADVPILFYQKTPDLKALQKNYQHMSTNPEWFELVCIERWFVLRNYLLTENRSRALYIDSDMLLFCNAQKEYDQFWNQCAFTLALGTSPAANFIQLDALQLFCDFVSKVYRDRSGDAYQFFAQTFAGMRKENRAGGICDMTLWKYFAQHSGLEWGEITKVQSDGSTWDHNINASDGYRMVDGIKQIDISVAVRVLGSVVLTPMGYTEQEGRAVTFKALHFQGGAKKLLPSFVRITRDTQTLHTSAHVSDDSFQALETETIPQIESSMSAAPKQDP